MGGKYESQKAAWRYPYMFVKAAIHFEGRGAWKKTYIKSTAFSSLLMARLFTKPSSSLTAPPNSLTPLSGLEISTGNIPSLILRPSQEGQKKIVS